MAASPSASMMISLAKAWQPPTSAQAEDADSYLCVLKLGEINIQHHDHEQEQHRNRPHINNDQECMARNSASISRKNPAELKKARMRKRTACTGLRAVITIRAENSNTAENT
jgi:hypothetical protein